MDLNRKTAYQVLLSIEKEGAYSNIALNYQIKENNPDSPAFVRELVYGVLENKIYIDYCLNSIIPSGLKKVKSQPLTLLRMGIYQLEFMNSVPKYAAINETVNLAKKFAKGRDGFINGVLRGYTKKKDSIAFPDPEKNLIDYLCIKYSFSRWIVELWMNQYGQEVCEKLLESMNSTPRLCIRANQLKTTREELCEMLEEKGFDVVAGQESNRALFVAGSNLLDSDLYAEGYFSVQDEASIVTADIVKPMPNTVTLDMCAAPGGKSLAMAELMENQGELSAFDVYAHKLKLIEKEAQRLGISIIKVSENDGCVYNSELKEIADYVLVDGPCSGLGVIRRKPEIKYKEIADNGKSLAEKQYDILTNSAKYVKKDGILVYSTCTVNKIENDDVVERFLIDNKDYIVEYKHQFMPCFEETDGFFVCKFARKG